MVIVEGRCTKLQLLISYILIIGWHKSIVSSDWSDTMVWFGQILLLLSFTILYIWSLELWEKKVSCHEQPATTVLARQSVEVECYTVNTSFITAWYSSVNLTFCKNNPGVLLCVSVISLCSWSCFEGTAPHSLTATDLGIKFDRIILFCELLSIYRCSRQLRIVRSNLH